MIALLLILMTPVDVTALPGEIPITVRGDEVCMSAPGAALLAARLEYLRFRLAEDVALEKRLSAEVALKANTLILAADRRAASVERRASAWWRAPTLWFGLGLSLGLVGAGIALGAAL